MLNFIFVLLILLCGLAGYLLWRFQSQSPEAIMLKALEEKHREMIVGLNDSLNKLTDRLNLALAEQGKIQGEIIRDTMDNATNQLKNLLNMRLQDIDSKVKESLEEGFKKTNDTFDRVMKQLSTIDEAQKKIDGLTTNIVSFQELLGDKKSRGAFGEVQLEGLVRNALPPDAFSMQHTLSNGNRADCVLFLPEPTGSVAIDSKFPLESYRKMLDTSLPPDEIKNAQKQFKLDIKKHIHDIASKYIISNETSDGAVMFIPAEAVFA